MKTYDVRVLLGALILFCVIAGGFTLWYHHQLKKLAEEDETFKQRQEERNQAPSSTRTVTNDVTEAERLVEEPTHPGDTAEMPQDTAAQPEPIQEAADSDAELPVAELNEEIAEDVPVSPYGFGPYPPLPEEWGPETWNNISANHELMARVEVKLISQGINVEGSAMEDGLVYPVIKGILYVKWRTSPGPNGVERYISDTLGHPDDGDRIASIREERGMDFSEDDIPSDIKLVPFEEGGINAYEFLSLQKIQKMLK